MSQGRKSLACHREPRRLPLHQDKPIIRSSGAAARLHTPRTAQEVATVTLMTRAGVCLATVLSSGVVAGQTRSVYSEFGVRTIINVAGSATRVGGAQMPPEVVRAMADAALESVSMMELHAAASRHIAAATGAEAGFITAGASAGLTLGTAAILAGLDLVKMERLP